MKAVVVKRSTVVCDPGSVVEISLRQFKALGDAVKAKPSPGQKGKKK